MPESKRYPDTQGEWAILLDRQNKIITDLLGYNANIFLVANSYIWKENNKLRESATAEAITRFCLIPLDILDLHQLYPDQYDEGQAVRPAFSEQVWQPGIFDELLKTIANDELDAFFVAKDGECVVAPYDGGIDFIVSNEATKNEYKHKYIDWLSVRADGL